MLLAWRSKEIHDLCASMDGLDRLWPAYASTAKELLSVVVAAPDLASLRPLRSIVVRPAVTRDRLIAKFSIHLEEVKMTGVVLDEHGRPELVPSPDQFWPSVGGRTAVEIASMSAAGRRLESAAVA